MKEKIVAFLIKAKDMIIPLLKKAGYLLLVWGRPIIKKKIEDTLMPTLIAKLKEKKVPDNVIKVVVETINTYVVNCL